MPVSLLLGWRSVHSEFPGPSPLLAVESLSFSTNLNRPGAPSTLIDQICSSSNPCLSGGPWFFASPTLAALTGSQTPEQTEHSGESWVSLLHLSLFVGDNILNLFLFMRHDLLSLFSFMRHDFLSLFSHRYFPPLRPRFRLTPGLPGSNFLSNPSRCSSKFLGNPSRCSCSFLGKPSRCSCAQHLD